jgi:hypothetical protein
MYLVYSDFLKITNQLNLREKSYLHYNSFVNFFDHYETIKSIDNKKIVKRLLLDYVQFINDYKEKKLDRNAGIILVNPYLFKIGKIYKNEMGFIEILSPKFLFIATFTIDLLLILFGWEKFWKIPIPVFSVAGVLFYYFYLNSNIKKGKVFGIFW